MLLLNRDAVYFEVFISRKVVQGAQKKILYRFQVRKAGSQASVLTA